MPTPKANEWLKNDPIRKSYLITKLAAWIRWESTLRCLFLAVKEKMICRISVNSSYYHGKFKDPVFTEN